jgi:hypothetical protein
MVTKTKNYTTFRYDTCGMENRLKQEITPYNNKIVIHALDILVRIRTFKSSLGNSLMYFISKRFSSFLHHQFSSINSRLTI